MVLWEKTRSGTIGDIVWTGNIAAINWIPMAQEFRDSIRQGQEPEASGLIGMEDLEITPMAYESMESGHPVLLEP